MKKWLGRVMITALFVAFFVAFGIEYGFANTALATGGTVFLVAWVFIACRLMEV